MLTSFLGVLFDGIASGCLLFLISVGLSVTMGMMNFLNLAHGAFAMLGGYLCLMAMTRYGAPFLATLPLAMAACGIVGALFERLLFRPMYRAGHLNQVLLTFGLVLMSIAAATFVWGPEQQPIRLPPFLTGQVKAFGAEFGTYRLFLVALVVVLTLLMVFLVENTRFGAQVRAAVDNSQASEGLGINVDRVFSVTFALGSALAGLGGALGIDVLGLDPTFPLKYLVYFLLVVTVGGARGIKGPLLAALILGVFDIVGKYYVPEAGAFIIYAVMVALLLAFPSGLFGRRT